MTGNANRAMQDWFKSSGADFLRQMGVRRGDAVADLGCGTGGYTVPLADVVPPGGTVTAVDVDPENLACVKRRLEERNLPAASVDLVQQDAVDWLSHQPEHRLDVVLLFDVLQHIEDWEHLFAECRRTMKASALLLINPSWHSHPGNVDEARLLSCLSKSGFVLRDRQWASLMHYKHMAEDYVLKVRSVTAFQHRVYSAVRQIPRGKVATYGELARYLQCGSAQAVGQALRRNPFAPQVPCHRVIAADRSPGGFSGARDGDQIERKRRLLAREGVRFDNEGRVLAEDLLRFAALSSRTAHTGAACR